MIPFLIIQMWKNKQHKTKKTQHKQMVCYIMQGLRMVKFSEDQNSQAKLKNELKLFLEEWVLYPLQKVVLSPRFWAVDD